MSQRVSDELNEEFGSSLILGGPEFDKFSLWKKEVADLILSKGIAYRVAKDNFDEACKKTKQYVFAAHRVVFEGKAAIPLGVRPWDVENLFNLVMMLKSDIKILIDIYNTSD